MDKRNLKNKKREEKILLDRIEKNEKKRYNNTIISGALNDKNDPYRQKRDKHADIYYESVRKWNKKIEIDEIYNNIKDISELKHFSISDIEKVYEHIFINTYELDGAVRNFDPDYDMSQSWQRLREGREILKHDIIMLLHERMEYDLMNIDGLDYRKAHFITTRKYNYLKVLNEWNKEE